MVKRQMTGLLIAAGCRQAFDWGHCPTAELLFRFTQRIRLLRPFPQMKATSRCVRCRLAE